MIIMKRTLFRFAQICLLNSVVFCPLKAQTCTFTDLRLNSQSQLNSFNATCKTVNGDITISGSDITDLAPLQNIEVINGKLTIQNNPALTNLSGLKNLTSAQHLLIYTNNLLTDLAGLEKLKSVFGATHIRYNPNLVNLKGLDSLAYASTFYITNNDLLTSMSGLGSLETVTDILSVGSNKSLASFIGLNNLTSVSRINISGNDTLTDLSGLESLTSVGYQMHVSSNRNLTSFKGLTNLTYLSEAYLSDNNLMTELSGLESVTSVYWLVVGENKGLTTLTGLHNLTSATNLIIRRNELLADLSGLENLTNIGWLQVSSNPELRTLSGLGTGANAGGSSGRVASLTIGGLSVRDNPKLTTCAISPVCDFVDTGTATISGNGPGCESQSTVQIACSSLPVTLAHFKAKVENGTTLLQWATAEESNSAVFEIEHSLNAITWQQAGAQNAKGESNALVSYQWIHTAPASGLNYYRLKMKDRDGSYAYSQIESLKFSVPDHKTVSVYPNPVSEVLFVENSKDVVRLRIVNLQGKTVYETSSAPNALRIKNLSAGLYHVHIIRQNGTVHKERIAVL
jgi:hypothetical protein